MEIAPNRKALTHERILDTAARVIRRAGFHGVGVADIMKEAGLTHGGFYAHFASRDALLAEALAHAGRQSAERIAKGKATREARGASPFRALVEGYLSERHLSGTENGCAVAALASEMPRQSPDVRAAAAQRVRGLIELVKASLPTGVEVAQAPAIASQMVGALQLARALGDNAEGKALLAANRSALLALFDAHSS
ncbi:TetR/AcrR family transcriptional regulator [Hydrogenophaga sp. IBVHS1]|uniref:TetR/AcrR family transcriptional regulator n=1 Tax=unclassified Hydrogenophaga TaxID=2610897 RepID=UPI000A2E254E|nr:TetR/AcrR family transcriptional regulator [Hydrogenophaga sp. IBVHS1]OSZ71467.1 TetR family transcriptional regulator [Hydrogenophaga sp. IBVHS1]